MLLFVLAGCNKPNETIEDDADFCSCLNTENKDKTIPFVDEFLAGLPYDFGSGQNLIRLIIWLNDLPCIKNAKDLHVFSNPPLAEILISFEENGITKERILDISLEQHPRKVIGYHDDNVKRIDFDCNEEFYCYWWGEKRLLGPPLNDWLLIAFDQQATGAEMVDFINQTGLFMPTNIRKINVWGNYRLLFVKTRGSKSCVQLQEIIRTLEKSPIVSFVSLTFTFMETGYDADIVSYLDDFDLTVKDESDLSDLHTLVSMTNTRIAYRYNIRTSKNSMGDALQMSNYFNETEKFISTHFMLNPRFIDRLSTRHDEEPEEIPYTELWKYSNERPCQREETQGRFPTLIVINSNEELEHHVCDALDFPDIDFSKQTLLIAYGRVDSLDDAYLQKFTTGYVLNLVLSGSVTSGLRNWEIAIVTDKLEKEKKVELIKIDYQPLYN